MSPTYDYYCDCGREWEEWNTIDARNYQKCSCGRLAKRKMTLNSKPIVLNYYSEGLGEFITGPKHKARVMKEKNLSEVGKVT